MTVSGCYVGYGINITTTKLLELLGLTDDKIKILEKCKTAKKFVLPHDYYSDCGYINLFLHKTPLVSETGMKFDCVTYPHTHDCYDKKLVCFGIFVHIYQYDRRDGTEQTKDAEQQLKNLMNSNMDFNKFKDTFGDTPKFMIIADDCCCCS